MSWSPAYCTAAELAGWLGVPNEGTELALACEAASRAIDRATGRQFGLLSSSEFRWYATEFYRGRWIADIDDLMTTTSLTVETVDAAGTPVAEITGYLLTPRNAASVGRPWTRVEILPSAAVKPDCNGVQVTARWGWTAVPEAIQLATLIQGARFHERRESPTGPLSSERVDDVSRGWASSARQELDPDVLASIAPYRKLWAAV